MFPFCMALSERMDFLKTGTTLYSGVNNNPIVTGLTYSQGYMDIYSSSSSNGYDRLKSWVL